MEKLTPGNQHNFSSSTTFGFVMVFKSVTLNISTVIDFTADAQQQQLDESIQRDLLLGFRPKSVPAVSHNRFLWPNRVRG